ncbi:hypothetical protein CYLTODRAFT_490246 [Cylindrobasidium torrendii FP15055 ss-10]|uniref:Uncharacterized protein n=1 Tax=Cylindrobasidium torrendii FP15055 ss-10 TaxID=1314674 RepID=A0A0D7BBL9_9AGAR|nr:hypothetical protein CYLTODRAFT_490246 [Cylindrobasidium torrendii FP15055 ss-10]
MSGHIQFMKETRQDTGATRQARHNLSFDDLFMLDSVARERSLSPLSVSSGSSSRPTSPSHNSDAQDYWPMSIHRQGSTNLDVHGDFIMDSPTPMQRRFRDLLPDNLHCNPWPVDSSKSTRTPEASHHALQDVVDQNSAPHSYGSSLTPMGAEPQRLEAYYAAQASNGPATATMPHQYNPFGFQFDAAATGAPHSCSGYTGMAHGRDSKSNMGMNRTMGPRKRAHSESESD